MAEQGFHRLRVREVIEETADAHSLVLSVPDELRERYRYRPGQWLTVRVPSDLTGHAQRSYSLSSSPYEAGDPVITVKRMPDGYVSNWICDNVVAGDELPVTRPAGRFTPRSLDGDLLLFAGGSGITPVMSILRAALAEGSARVSLIYANRDERSVIFAGALRGLAAAHPDRLLVTHWLESVQGLPSVAQLRELARPYAGYDAFICGPDPFMDAVETALTELGLPRGRIHQERFVTFADEEPAVEPPPAEEADDAAGSAAVEIRLDGETHNLTWPAGKKLLDLALESGLDAPFSCRQGQCGACTTRLVEGEVKLLNNEVLDDQDLAEGYILACQSLPVSDSVTVTYDEG